MQLYEIILIGLGLSMDCFAIALSFGTTHTFKWRDTLKMAFFFGLFQGVMPLLGWLLGDWIRQYFESIDHWIAFSILAVIGIRMIVESFRKESDKKKFDIHSTSVLITLSVATSIDALMTGIGLGFLKVNLLFTVSIIALITFLVTITGVRLGDKTTFLPARWAERTGGIVLIVIGLRILIQHLL
ncbi:MAG: manganese efflux pump MntP family protein [Bacteroidota bacterium]|nr:manganese efflux pump MntP family protein [Bacteroidota bacterium]